MVNSTATVDKFIPLFCSIMVIRHNSEEPPIKDNLQIRDNALCTKVSFIKRFYSILPFFNIIGVLIL